MGASSRAIGHYEDAVLAMSEYVSLGKPHAWSQVHKSVASPESSPRVLGFGCSRSVFLVHDVVYKVSRYSDYERHAHADYDNRREYQVSCFLRGRRVPGIPPVSLWEVPDLCNPAGTGTTVVVAMPYYETDTTFDVKTAHNDPRVRRVIRRWWANNLQDTHGGNIRFSKRGAPYMIDLVC